MIKKILLPSFTAIVGIALISGFYSSAKKQYSERVEIVNESEPNIMEWAQVDVNTGEFNPMSRLQAKSMINQRASRAGEIGLEFAMRGPDNVGGRTRAIIELIGKRDKDITEESQSLTARLQLLNYKAEIRYKDWFHDLKQQSNIEILTDN